MYARSGLDRAVLVTRDLEDTAEANLAERGLAPVGEFESGDFRELFYHPAAFGGAFHILAAYGAPHAAATAMTGD